MPTSTPCSRSSRRASCASPTSATGCSRRSGSTRVSDYRREDEAEAGSRSDVALLPASSRSRRNLRSGRSTRIVWLPRLDSEEANLRAALAWTSVATKPRNGAVRLVGCAVSVLGDPRPTQAKRGSWLERSLGLGNAVAPELSSQGPDRRRPRRRHGIPTGLQSIRCSKKPSSSRRDSTTRRASAAASDSSATRASSKGDIAGAAAALDEGVELARTDERSSGLARALSNAAWSAIEERDFDRARRMFEEGAAITRSDRNEAVRSALPRPHRLYRRSRRQFRAGLRHLEESLILFEELGQTTWTPVAQRYIGLVALLEREHRRGRAATSRESAARDARTHHSSTSSTGSRSWPRSRRAKASQEGGHHSGQLRTAHYERLGMAVIEEGRQVRERYRTGVRRPLGRLEADTRARGRAMTLNRLSPTHWRTSPAA